MTAKLIIWKQISDNIKPFHQNISWEPQIWNIWVVKICRQYFCNLVHKSFLSFFWGNTVFNQDFEVEFYSNRKLCIIGVWYLSIKILSVMQKLFLLDVYFTISSYFYPYLWEFFFLVLSCKSKCKLIFENFFHSIKWLLFESDFLCDF